MKITEKRIAVLACMVSILLCHMPVSASPMGVFVSIAPQKYFVQKIGGDLV